MDSIEAGGGNGMRKNNSFVSRGEKQFFPQIRVQRRKKYEILGCLSNILWCFATQVVFLYRVLDEVGYTELNVLSIRRRLYRVKYFLASKQVIQSRIFLLFQIDFTGKIIPAILCSLS